MNQTKNARAFICLNFCLGSSQQGCQISVWRLTSHFTDKQPCLLRARLCKFVSQRIHISRSFWHSICKVFVFYTSLFYRISSAPGAVGLTGLPENWGKNWNLFFFYPIEQGRVRLKYWCSILSLISLILARKKLLLKTGQTSPVSDFDESKVMVYLHQVENNLYYAKLVCITEICKVLRC